MSAMLDLDQLRTFVAIVDTGSFAQAAEVVSKTQSAVSMQVRRLEERIGRQLFTRDGRRSKLTEDGERLLGYARRMLRLSDETVAVFDETELRGSVRFGTPDDYADRFLPEILARFSRSNPQVEVSVMCDTSTELIAKARNGELDLAIVTYCGEESVEVFRSEPLLWAVSAQHCVAEEDVLPLALFKAPCRFRAAAIDALTDAGRKLREPVASLVEKTMEMLFQDVEEQEIPVQHEDHWRWRLRMAERIAARVDPVAFGVKAMYVFGSTKNATAGPMSDIDLLVHDHGPGPERERLALWLQGWSETLAEINYLRTGYEMEGLLDVHYVTDEDIARQESYAVKIGAVTDAARPLALGPEGETSA